MRYRRLAILAIAMVLSACDPTTVEPSAPSHSGDTTLLGPWPVVASTALSVDRYQWDQASISTEPQSLLIDVASAPFGWVAVGGRINFAGGEASFAPSSNPFSNFQSAVVWTSADGRTWTRHADDPEFAGAIMTKVVGTGSGALIFGTSGICVPDACGGLPPNGGTVVWWSSDGDRWERLTDTGLANGAVTDVTPVDGGLVAGGFIANDGSKPDNDPFGDPTDAAVWHTADGRHWTAIPGLPVADRISRVSAQDSTVIALASAGSGTVPWISSDGGETWADGAPADDGCCAYTAVRGGIAVTASWVDAGDVAAGIVNVMDATSASWTRDTPAEMHGMRPEWAQTLGGSFVIFGWTIHRDSDYLLVDDLPIAFSSPDGTTWVRAALPAAWDGKAPFAVADGERELVVILGPLDTVNGPPDALTQTVWIGTASD